MAYGHALCSKSRSFTGPVKDLVLVIYSIGEKKKQFYWHRFVLDCLSRHFSRLSGQRRRKARKDGGLGEEAVKLPN